MKKKINKIEKIKNAIKNIIDELDKSAKNTETRTTESGESLQVLYAYLKKIMQNMNSLDKVFDIEEDKVQYLYTTAIAFYKNSNFKSSANLFHSLITIRPNQFEFMFGYAACLQEMKEYQKSMASYLCSSPLDISNPEPYYYAYICNEKLKNKDKISSVVLLHMAIHTIKDQKKYQQLKDKCYLLYIEHLLKLSVDEKKKASILAKMIKKSTKNE